MSNQYELKERIANRENEDYLKQTARPKVRRSEITDAYLRRDLWQKLENPIYIDRGGIISLMGRSVIEAVLSL